MNGVDDPPANPTSLGNRDKPGDVGKFIAAELRNRMTGFAWRG